SSDRVLRLVEAAGLEAEIPGPASGLRSPGRVGAATLVTRAAEVWSRDSLRVTSPGREPGKAARRRAVSRAPGSTGSRRGLVHRRTGARRRPALAHARGTVPRAGARCC